MGSTAADLKQTLIAGQTGHEDDNFPQRIVEKYSFMVPPQDRPFGWHCAPCCWDSAPWRSSCCDCCSKLFVANMTLFEQREIEALYLYQSKNGRRAKIIPPLIMALACVLSVGPIFEAVSTELGLYAVFGAPTVPFAVIGFVLVCCAAKHERLRYQLRVAVLGVALATATIAYALNSTVMFSAIDPFINLLGLLWVCQMALVISDVVAARILVVVVPANALILVAGASVGLQYHFDGEHQRGALIRVVCDVMTSIVASSAVLLWMALRNEAASRTVFYWTHVVRGNVEALDAEANPFNAKRLQNWLSSRDNVESSPHSLEMTTVTDPRRASTSEFWELDSSALCLQSTIAAGGAGVVWKATLNDKVVAAKQLHDDASGNFAMKAEELAAEIEVLAQLSHPHIVRFLGLCRHNDGSNASETSLLPLFIIQEYCATNLAALLTDVLPHKEEHHWASEVLRIAFEIANAMAYLHSRTVEHRDLKPANIFLTNMLEVRVGDFGISSQFVHASSRRRSSSGVNPGGGTLPYMSPEAMGFGPEAECGGFKPYIDVYAFGVVLCEMLHSQSGAGLLDVLQLNGEHNRNLVLAEACAGDGNVATLWKLPQPPELSDGPTKPLLRLYKLCCAFDISARPKFIEIKRQLQPCPSNDDCSNRVRSDSSGSDSVLFSARRASALKESAPDRSARLSITRLESGDDFALAGRQQVGVHVCACRCWSGRKSEGGLLFRDDDLEARFLAFLHSDLFFKHLRWPYIVLACLNAAFAAAMIVVHDYPHALYPLSVVALFGGGVCFSWCSKLQRYSLATLTGLAVLSSIVQCATAWMDNFDAASAIETKLENITFTHPNSSDIVEYTLWCSCDLLPNMTCADECTLTFSEYFLPNYGLALFQGLTAPVTLLVLGLPCYLYSWLLTMAALSWTVTAISFADVAANKMAPGTAVVFSMVVVAGVALYPICMASAVFGERSRRKMFLTFCRLRTQENNLLERATFRGYREALLANWRYLASSSSSGGSSSKRHVVTSATV